MRLLLIAGGAAGSYCGSCLRDNALATELLGRRHDVVLLPVYTPLLTDEPNVSQRRVFLGGISVYLEQHVPLLRRTPRFVDRLWDAPAVLRFASRRAIHTDPGQLGEMTLSMLRGAHGFQHKEIDKLVDWLRRQPPFDLVSLPNSLLIGLAGPIREALGRPVCCTFQGEDLFLDSLGDGYRRQAIDLIQSQIASVDAFIGVSAFYVERMCGYLGIPRQKMRVVPLGINRRGYGPAPDGRGDGPFTIGYFARIAPEKGLHVLCDAYRLLRQNLWAGSSTPAGRAGPCRLEVAGSLSPQHREYLARVERQMNEWGLGAEFRYHGAVDRDGKTAFLRSLDVLSVPATYEEPKGMFLLEAMANGVPVVQPRRGAFPEIIEKTGGGLLVDPDDPASLAEGLARLAREPALAADLARRGLAGVAEHYDVARMADRTLEVFQELVGR
jgi:glycosyltransferase involved in cell wall biosynthesis